MIQHFTKTLNRVAGVWPTGASSRAAGTLLGRRRYTREAIQAQERARAQMIESRP